MLTMSDRQRVWPAKFAEITTDEERDEEIENTTLDEGEYEIYIECSNCDGCGRDYLSGATCSHCDGVGYC